MVVTACPLSRGQMGFLAPTDILKSEEAEFWEGKNTDTSECDKGKNYKQVLCLMGVIW